MPSCMYINVSFWCIISTCTCSLYLYIIIKVNPFLPTAPADFVAVQDRLIILDSEVTHVETNVSIVPDNRLEINENFFANLRLSASDAQVLISPNISTIEIIDDDGVLNVITASDTTFNTTTFLM